ncbi:MAG: hypothetical protein O2779_04315, partial [Nanoarchaeota archaeon]|nr:hypothetical protein [Nanoarchaeota archaeon]
MGQITRSMSIYPNREKAFQKELEALRKAPISHKNRELITGFQNHLFAKNNGFLRIAKLTCQLRKLAAQIDKDMDTLDKLDIITAVAAINQRVDLSDATKADYRCCIKQFYNWFVDEDPRMLSKDLDVR